MDEDGTFDSGFDDGGPFRVTPEAGGVSLESALRDYGPAAIDDLIPRLRAIARLLDAAHAAGRVHGALHPSRVIVHDDATSLVAGSVPVQPYAAPEMAESGATPASDQFGLAAIAYEWLFGRPIDHPAHRAVEVRTMPGVDRVALSKAFTRALAPDPAHRFASCLEFCGAIAGAVIPELPFNSQRRGALLIEDRPLIALEPEDEHDDPVGPFVPEPAPVDEVRNAAEESIVTAVDPVLHTIDPIISQPAAVPSSNRHEPQRFGGYALILAAIVGAIVGFAAGYMARPRALQGGAPHVFATEREPVAPVTAAPGASVATTPGTPSQAPQTADASRVLTKASAGRLLVRSTPSGASVSVDGVAKARPRWR